jgi:hypothetical protein
VVLTGRALGRKRRRTILSQESGEAEEEHVPTPQPLSRVSRSLVCSRSSYALQNPRERQPVLLHDKRLIATFMLSLRMESRLGGNPLACRKAVHYKECTGIGIGWKPKLTRNVLHFRQSHVVVPSRQTNKGPSSINHEDNVQQTDDEEGRSDEHALREDASSHTPEPYFPSLAARNEGGRAGEMVTSAFTQGETVRKSFCPSSIVKNAKAAPNADGNCCTGPASGPHLVKGNKESSLLPSARCRP